VKTGKHTVTAISRADSKSTIPKGVEVVRVDYDNEDSLVSALKGQQFLIITLAVRGPPDTHDKLVQAAAKAGVPYIMPNVYGTDYTNKKLGEECLYGPTCDKHIAKIEELGASSYIILCCGMWYEWSLALPPQWYGFDIKNKKVTFYDDGKTRINTSTWGYCGQALAKLLSLKELPEDGNDTSPTISQWKNKGVYISSFLMSQRDMLDSIHQLTGTTDKDWTIEYEPTAERYQNGLDEMKKGDWTGYAKAMYARVFFPNGDGDFETSRGLDSASIGLGKDDLEAATKRTLKMVESGWNPF
jgi:hypothetical protein